MNTQTITSFIRNPLSFFVSEPIEEIADWSPSQYYGESQLGDSQ
jgi:hypothetical protein